MKKIKLYHSCNVETLESISKYGLIKSPFCDTIFFCKDKLSSVKWIERRNSIKTGIKIEELGLVTFETTLNDPFLVSTFDYDCKYLDNIVDIDLSVYVYNRSIEPEKLSFQVVKICEDDFIFYDKSFNNIYKKPGIKLLREICETSMDNIVYYDENKQCYHTSQLN